MQTPKPPAEPQNELLLIGYARVSTKEQRLDLQIDALRAAGVTDDHLHVEKLSATSKNRPMLDMAIKDLRPGETLVVWRIDRLARNMRDLYARLHDIHEAGGKFRSLQEDFDFGTYMGEFVLGIFGLVAQLERQLTQHRTKAGIASWVARGGKPGRQPVMDKDLQARCLALLRQKLKDGTPRHKTEHIAKMIKVAKSSIYGYFTVSYTKRGRRVVKRRAG